MKSVLLTGASGFVGANLTRRLLSDGHEIHALLRPEHATWRLEGIRNELELHPIDLSDFDAVSKLVRRVVPDWIFHLAAHGAYPSQKDFREMVETNVLGTMNLLEACLATGFEAFINSGSSSEYGFKDHPPSEDERPDPNSHYAVTKAAATMYGRYAATHYDANVVTLRLYSVYGPFEEPTRLWPTLIVKGLNGHLPVLVDSEIARDFVYVDDVVEAYVRTASAPNVDRGSVFNVGTGRQTTMRELVELARRELEIEEEPEWGTMERRSWDTEAWVSDVRKIRQELGWAAEQSVEAGFRRFTEWFRSNQDIRMDYEGRLGK